MAPHSSTLAWKIPWTEDPGRLQSMGLLSRTRLSDFRSQEEEGIQHETENHHNNQIFSGLD